jgi:hypothetical protein
MRYIIDAVLSSVIVLASVSSAHAQARVTIDHNTGIDANSVFKFKHVPPPVRDDVAGKAKLTLIVGRKDGDSAELNALTDGLFPGGADEPETNFFFGSGTDGGRIRLDLENATDIAQVNTYSWHASTRGPQIYNLFASDGSDPKFNPAPDGKTDPATCGWKLIATVDTRPSQGSPGGQYGVSVSDPSGSLGTYRYLLIDSIPTEWDDAFGNTFFSEIDVIARR